MLGRDDEYVGGLERAHYAHLDAGKVPAAAECAWWIGANLFLRGETAPASGWFVRGERLRERDGRDCVECVYLRLGRMLQHFADGDFEAACAAAAEADLTLVIAGRPDSEFEACGPTSRAPSVTSVSVPARRVGTRRPRR